MNGTVKNLFALKHYGFIRSGNKDYFFHRDDFIGHWQDMVLDHMQGKEIPVEFELGEKSNKGLRAAGVKRSDYPNQAV